ncbi:MAG: PASTA domain-containing protein, partial [Acidimicrobiia bacterium]
MSDWIVENRRFVNVGVLLITMVVVSLIFAIGYEPSDEVPEELRIGEPSPQTFVANRSIEGIADPDKTEAARTTAENNVRAPYTINQVTTQDVVGAINLFYTQLDDGALEPPPTIQMKTVPDLVGKNATDASALAEDENLTVDIVRFVEPPEEIADGTVESQTPSPGVSVPEGSNIDVVMYKLGASSTTVGETTTTVPEITTTTLARRSTDDQIADLMRDHRILTEATVTQFVDLFGKDLDRVAEGDPSVFPQMQAISAEWAAEELTAGIRGAIELNDVQQKYLNPTTRPPITIAGLSDEDLQETHEAIASLVARRLQSNEAVDTTQWEIDKQAARDAVPGQTTSYAGNETIVEVGEPLTSVQITAIRDLGLYEPEVQTGVPLSALVLFGIIIVLILVFLLVRIAPRNLDRPRRVALMGIILMLSAAASRVPEIVSASDHAIGYIIPAVAIG